MYIYIHIYNLQVYISCVSVYVYFYTHCHTGLLSIHGGIDSREIKYIEARGYRIEQGIENQWTNKTKQSKFKKET